MEIVVKDELLILSAMRAIYWPRKKALVLADMHLGKTGYFRSQGIAIPSTVMAGDLQRLSLLISTYQAKMVIVAGDMFHHDYNADIDQFRRWREQHSNVDFILVPGNHDKLLNIDYEALAISVTAKEYFFDPFMIVHHPDKDSAAFSISGHLHPGYQMAGRARQTLRLPCFIIGNNQIILPAFSAFTGLYTGYQREEADCYYLIGNDTIFKI